MATRIPYLDEAWNVTTGCGDDQVSPGCLNCYARRMFGRNLWTQPCPDCDGSGSLGQAHDGREVSCETCGGHEDALGSGTVPQDFTPTFHADRLDQPLHWRKPRVVGVSFMGDLFHEGITFEQRDEVCRAMCAAPQHTYIMLTKRPGAMRRFFSPEDDRTPCSNWCLGVTVCNQEEADRNIPLLLDTPAAVRWVSLEPMLGAVDLRPGLYEEGFDPEYGPLGPTGPGPFIDWVVLGGETGPGARPMQPEWALDAYRQCKVEGVAFWFKQWGDHDKQHGVQGVHFKASDVAMENTHELPAALAEAVAL